MEFPAGRIFHVATVGYNKMPSYAGQLSASERWKIVTYIKTVLQSWGATASPQTSAKASSTGGKK